MEPPGDNALARLVTTFEGQTLNVIWLRGLPYWSARQVGEVLGYAEGGRRFADKITGEWSAELVEGVDHMLVNGEDLAAIKSLLGPDTIDPRTPSLLLLTQQGVFAASMLSRQPKAKALRRWLSAEVLPEIAATGSYGARALPAPSPAAVRFEVLRELRGDDTLTVAGYATQLGALLKTDLPTDLRHQTIDELIRLAAPTASSPEPATLRRRRARADGSNPLVKLRLSRGMTQDDISEQLGNATRGVWSMYETGRREPKISKLEKIFEIFKATPEERDEVRAWFRRVRP
ncbi:MAG TPA: helix-turn-helix domain-containing protein [Myxococcota bacterium]|nr:helix-turn-helix domain-containing protein [Myxococcota bacterium]